MEERPDRMALLLGPWSGKSTLLLAPAGKLEKILKKKGTITYNGHKVDEFFVQRVPADISQTDNHIAELTVRETLDFTARCQGANAGFSGLDSSTTFQISNCLRNFVHVMEGTALMALLQPVPETFEGYLVYQGPRAEVVEFFDSLGLRLPPHKNVADFLQEVTSKKDKAQYWGDPSKPYQFIPVSKIAEEFRKSRYGQNVGYELSDWYDKSKSHPSALPMTKYVASRCELFKACFSRELFLIDRHRFSDIFRTVQTSTGDMPLGSAVLHIHSLPTDGYWYWIGVRALLGYTFLFNVAFTFALAFLNRQAEVSSNDGPKKKGMILPFEPLTITSHNINYYVDMLKVPKKKRMRLKPNVSMNLRYKEQKQKTLPWSDDNIHAINHVLKAHKSNDINGKINLQEFIQIAGKGSDPNNSLEKAFELSVQSHDKDRDSDCCCCIM